MEHKTLIDTAFKICKTVLDKGNVEFKTTEIKINIEKEIIDITFDDKAEVYIDLSDYSTSYTSGISDEATEEIFEHAFGTKVVS